MNTAQGKVSDAVTADIKENDIARYYQHLPHASKISYHKPLANTYYRNKQWGNVLREYRQLKQLGGANLKAHARLLFLRFVGQANRSGKSPRYFTQEETK